MRRTRVLVLAVTLLIAGGCRPAGAQAAAPLPGAEGYSAELQAELARALAAEGEAYVPRTRHLEQDGSPKFTNRLILESSPYLRQHAHNPVNWYPWGDEAFETARKLGRPVLLSIGYSTCHWCHVMEEESFEDEEIAAFLNANYVAIKVDREERPDVDSIYMSAVQMLVGRGGWPMTTWLNPDRAPFYGGTYFPARDGDRGSRKGFLTLLRELRQVYDDQPETVAQRAQQIATRIRTAMAPSGEGKLPAADSLDLALQQYRGMFDATHGGLTRAPKFPSSLPIRLLLRYAERSGDEHYLEMAQLTLTRMAHGGMYDQVGGGFHRYSVTGDWLVPHFEKMLYDNALLAVAYVEGYQRTKDPEFARVAREILRYVAREMTAPEGAFYSATDADSLTPEGHREEGWFFTWTPAELRQLLGEDEAAAIEAFYGTTAAGNFEGRNILNITRSMQETAAALGIEEETLRKRLESARGKLYEARARRPRPLRDDKVLTSWNGLMISAFALGGFVLEEPDFTARAERAAEFVLGQLQVDGRLRRSYKGGRARFNAYLDDYAFLIAGLLDLYETTWRPHWLEQAMALQRTLDKHYRDAARGGYYLTSDDHEALLAREKPASDGAEPSGNSVALLNLLRLYELTSEERYHESAEKLLHAFGDVLTRAPRALSEMLMGLDFYYSSPREVVLVAREAGQLEPFLDVLRQHFVPNKVVTVVVEGDSPTPASERLPLARGKVAKDGKTTAYVCERGVCQLPTTDVAVFGKQLLERPKAPDPEKTGKSAAAGD